MTFTYKLIAPIPPATEVSNVRRSDGWGIPFDPANTDYQQFKKDIENGAELQDSEGVVMTPEAAKAFIQTLP